MEMVGERQEKNHPKIHHARRNSALHFFWWTIKHTRLAEKGVQAFAYKELPVRPFALSMISLSYALALFFLDIHSTRPLPPSILFFIDIERNQ